MPFRLIFRKPVKFVPKYDRWIVLTYTLLLIADIKYIFDAQEGWLDSTQIFVFRSHANKFVFLHPPFLQTSTLSSRNYLPPHCQTYL